MVHIELFWRVWVGGQRFVVACTRGIACDDIFCWLAQALGAANTWEASTCRL